MLFRSIECPIDPYTEDEFFDKSTLTPKQLKKAQELYRSSEKEWFINYSKIDKIGFDVSFEMFGIFDDDWDGYNKYHDVIQERYGTYDIDVRREWNGKRFVKAKSTFNKKDKE